MSLGWDAPSARDCIEAVCHVWGVTVEELKSDSRRAALAKPRQAAYWLARTAANRSYPQLGMVFGRDHTTIMHGARLTFWEASFDPELASMLRSAHALAWRAVEARHAAVMARDASSNRWLAVDLRQSQALEALA